MSVQTEKKKSSYREALILIAFVIIGASLGLILGEKASVLYPIGQIWLNLLFVLSAVSFDLSKVNMAVVFVFIIVMIGIVYIKNQLFYINPFLNIFGYNFYKISYIEDNKTKTDYVFCKNDIVVGLGYYVKFNKNFSFVDCSKNNTFDCSKTDNKK